MATPDGKKPKEEEEEELSGDARQERKTPIDRGITAALWHRSRARSDSDATG